MKYKIGEIVKILDCKASGGAHNNPRYETIQKMIGKNYVIERYEYGYYVIDGWHFAEFEITIVKQAICEKCGHELIDSYGK